jgi:hypothetical protein
MSNAPKWMAVSALTVAAVVGAATVLTQQQSTANQRVVAAAPAPTAPSTEATKPTTPSLMSTPTPAAPSTEVAAFEIAASEVIPNEMIDYPTFKRVVDEVGAERESKRLTEQAFFAAMNEPNVVLLDVRNQRSSNSDSGAR